MIIKKKGNNLYVIPKHGQSCFGHPAYFFPFFRVGDDGKKWRKIRTERNKPRCGISKYYYFGIPCVNLLIGRYFIELLPFHNSKYVMS